MPSRRAVIVSSCEPCASARSKPRPFAYRFKRPQPAGERGGLAEARAAAVAPDHLGLDPVPLEQLERLRVVARRHLDLVATLPQEPDQRPEHQHVRRRGDVDPDLHLASASSRGSRSGPGVRSTWRSCQSVNASRPQSWRLRSSRPATWSSIRRVTASGRKKPWRRSVSAESVSRANGSSSPRSQAAAGIEKPRLRAPEQLGRDERRGRLPQQHLLAQAAHLVPARQREREVRDHGVEERARAPRASAPSRRGRSSRAGRRRGRCRGRRPGAARAARRPRSPRSAREAGRRGRSSLRRPVSSARALGEKISFQPWWRSSGGRCAARTKRFAL